MEGGKQRDENTVFKKKKALAVSASGGSRRCGEPQVSPQTPHSVTPFPFLASSLIPTCPFLPQPHKVFIHPEHILQAEAFYSRCAQHPKDVSSTAHLENSLSSSSFLPLVPRRSHWCSGLTVHPRDRNSWESSGPQDSNPSPCTTEIYCL